MIPGRKLGQTLLFLAALALRAPAVAEPIEQTVEQLRNNVGEVDRLGPDFVHRPSGYVFPGKLGNLPARKTVTYGPGDASLYYTLFGGGNGDAWLTLYVYPVTRSFEDEVADVEQALLQRVSGIFVEPPAGVPPLPTGAREKWFDGSIEGAPVVTGYRVIRDGAWYIKARLTIPKSGGQPALDRAWNALGAVPWSVGRQHTPSASESRAAANT